MGSFNITSPVTNTQIETGEVLVIPIARNPSFHLYGCFATHVPVHTGFKGKYDDYGNVSIIDTESFFSFQETYLAREEDKNEEGDIVINVTQWHRVKLGVKQPPYIAYMVIPYTFVEQLNNLQQFREIRVNYDDFNEEYWGQLYKKAYGHEYSDTSELVEAVNIYDKVQILHAYTIVFNSIAEIPKIEENATFHTSSFQSKKDFLSLYFFMVCNQIQYAPSASGGQGAHEESYKTFIKWLIYDQQL